MATWEYYFDEWTRYQNLYIPVWRKLWRDKRACDHLKKYHYSLFLQWLETENPETKKKMDAISTKMGKLKRKNEIVEWQLAIWDDYKDHYSKLLEKCQEEDWKKDVNMIDRKRALALEREPCCICFETHSLKDIMVTCCGHTYGQVCIETMIRKQKRKHQTPTCPLCRKSDMKFSLYRVKKRAKN